MTFQVLLVTNINILNHEGFIIVTSGNIVHKETIMDTEIDCLTKWYNFRCCNQPSRYIFKKGLYPTFWVEPEFWSQHSTPVGLVPLGKPPNLTAEVPVSLPDPRVEFQGFVIPKKSIDSLSVLIRI